MNIALGIGVGISLVVIFGVIIPRLLSGLPHKHNKPESVIPWRNFDQFDGK